MMEIAVYDQAHSAEEKLEDFINLIYSSQMRYLASELLDYGLSPLEITDAVLRAISAVKSGGIRVNEHFMPLYTEVFGQMVRDCKMSAFGRAMVLLNATPKNKAVGSFQIRVIRNFLT